MNDFEKELRKAFTDEERFDSRKSETVKKEVVEMYDKKRRILIIISWVFIGLQILEMMIAAGLFFVFDSTKVMILCAVWFLAAYESTILAKLAFHIISARWKILEEIAQLRLEIGIATQSEDRGER